MSAIHGKAEGHDWLLNPGFHRQEGGQEAAVKMNQKTPSLYSSKLSFLIDWFINCWKINQRTSQLPAPYDTKSFVCRVPRVPLVQTVPQPRLVQMFTCLNKRNRRRWAAGKNADRLLPCKGFLRALQIATNLPTAAHPSRHEGQQRPEGSSLSLQTTAILLLRPKTSQSPRSGTESSAQGPSSPSGAPFAHVQPQQRFGLQRWPLPSWFCKARVSPRTGKADNPRACSITTFPVSAGKTLRNGSSSWNLSVILHRAPRTSGWRTHFSL